MLKYLLFGEKMYSRQSVKFRDLNLKNLIMGFTLSMLLALVLTGCATHLQKDQPSGQHENADLDSISAKSSNTQTEISQNKAAAQPSSGLPVQELTPELLYDLMLAEIALQRNDYALAFDKYYEAARQTRDSRLAKKATRVTLFSKDDAQTFKAVKLWSEIQPENIDVQQIYASSLISQKQDEQALIYLQKVIALSDNFEQGFKRAFAILETIEEHDRANNLFVRLTADYKNEPIIKLYQAKLAFKFVDYPSTEKYLN